MTPPPISTSNNNFLQSPNAIPPRTSSTGQPANTTAASSRASVLRPVPEADWIAQSTHTRSPPTRPRQQRAWSASHGSSPLLPQTNILLNMPEPPAKPDPARFAVDDFGFIGGQKKWAQKQDRVIMGPFEYLNGQRGKDFRSQLIAAFNTWLDVSTESLEIITKVVGMLHTASLLIDDVEDNSILRRGLPVAHSLFGVPQTINSANYVYFYALEELQKLNNNEVITVYAEELLNLHRGQGMDLFWRDTLTCPTEDEYLEMVGNKTGGLFRLGIKLMQAESRAKNVVDCVPLVNLIGLIFQIRDDYQNLHSTEYSENKGLAEDLTEGKFSFPVIHSIRSDPGNLQLINILKQRTSDEEVKRYAVKYMEGTGTFEYTLKVLDVLIQRARKVAEEIDRSRGEGRNKGIEMILDRMVIGGKGEMHFPAKG
ncbi:geranylgeranyl pyrophosphate synthetase [Gnomoniopsis sp. IMI 355080]|nr:geranylgeranyl pyrophosphate synthetase [Gnomoniopsis sp. IMI 355080]